MDYNFTSRENDSDLMREGEYEVYLKECGPAETKTGVPCIKFDFVVRPDIEQAYKNTSLRISSPRKTEPYPTKTWKKSRSGPMRLAFPRAHSFRWTI